MPSRDAPKIRIEAGLEAEAGHVLDLFAGWDQFAYVQAEDGVPTITFMDLEGTRRRSFDLSDFLGAIQRAAEMTGVPQPEPSD